MAERFHDDFNENGYLEKSNDTSKKFYTGEIVRIFMKIFGKLFQSKILGRRKYIFYRHGGQFQRISKKCWNFFGNINLLHKKC